MIDQIIALKEKQIELLKELQTSEMVKQYDYYIKPEGSFFVLVKSADNTLVKIDRMDRIKSWLNIRNITSYVELNK